MRSPVVSFRRVIPVVTGLPRVPDLTGRSEADRPVTSDSGGPRSRAAPIQPM